MPDIDVLEEVLNTAKAIAPIWDDQVWVALQAQRFDEAETYLQSFLSKMSASEWANVYWMGIVNGIPAFRGELDETTWKNKALPAIGKAMIRAASPIKISAAYSSVGGDALPAFHNFVSSAIPETALDKKLGWLKSNQSSLINFFLGSPALAQNFLTSQNISRLKTLPEDLRMTISSAQTAEIIKRVCEQNNVLENKTLAVAGAVGLVLLGFIHPEELASEIATRTGIAQQVAKDVSDSLATRIFNPLRDLLDRAYAPVPHEHEIPQPPKLVEEIKAMPAPPPPPPSGPAAPSSGFVGEFARLGATKEPAAPEKSKPPVVSHVEPPPTMLHEETLIKSAPQTSSFKIEAPTPKLSDIRAKESEIPKPAILDFGGSTSKPPVPPPLPKTTAPESKPSDATLGKPFDGAQGKPFDGAQGKPFDGAQGKTPRIVHYTEFRTPLDGAQGKPFDGAQGKPFDGAQGKPFEKPPEKPSEISGAQAPSNIPLAENKPESSSTPPAPASPMAPKPL